MDSRKILLNSCLQTTDSLKIQKNPSKYLLNNPHMHQSWNSTAEQSEELQDAGLHPRIKHNSVECNRKAAAQHCHREMLTCEEFRNLHHMCKLVYKPRTRFQFVFSLTHMDNRFASEFELRYYSELFKTHAFKWLSTASSFRSVPRARQRKRQPGWHTRWCDDCMKMGFP